MYKLVCIFLSVCLSVCLSGHDLDEYGYHLLACKYGVDLCGLTIES